MDITSIDISEVKWVCVVEKEAGSTQAPAIVMHDLALSNRGRLSSGDSSIISTI